MGSAEEGIRFFVSGCIGTVLFYGLYETIHWILPADLPLKMALCWTLSYLCSIAWQHKLHCVIVFYDSPIKSYWQSLGRFYVVYSLSLVLSSLLTVVFDVIGLQYQISWVLTLLVTGLINYFTVRDFVMQ